jgi:NAD(P)-dependent dehydrogenase (short-subunit alcohol dehydrogenase family)
LSVALKGRTALVTGATGNLGREITWALGKAGAKVLVNSRSAKKSDFFVSELIDYGIHAEAAVFDLLDGDAVEEYARKLGPDLPLHILINNAHAGRGGTFKTSTAQDFRSVYEINVVAAHRLMQLVLPNMELAVKQSGDAAIVNIISMYGLVSPDPRNYEYAETTSPPFYGSAKAALAQLTRYIASELGPKGIRCNAVAPGPFPSINAQQDAPELMRRLINRVPLGRLGSPAEIGPPILFLASPDSSFITGSILPVDGGWTIW